MPLLNTIRKRLRANGLGSPPYSHGILMHLHAHELKIENYFTEGEALHLVAPIPSHMALTLKSLFSNKRIPY